MNNKYYQNFLSQIDKIVNSRKLIFIDIGDSKMCLQSYPCQHTGQKYLVFEDGSSQKVNISSLEIGLLCFHYKIDTKPSNHYRKEHFIQYIRYDLKY